MTTYTLQGFSADWQDNADWSDIDYTGYSTSITATIVAESGGGFSYVNDAAEEDGDVWADVTVSDTNAFSVDGNYIYPFQSNGILNDNVSLFSLTWKSGGTTYVTYLLEVSLEWGDNSEGKMQGTDYYFVIGGDDLPAISSLAEFEEFANTDTYITGMDELTGELAEGEFIPWTLLGDIAVYSEDDDLFGTNGKDVLNGQAGDDYFISSKGNDTYNGGAGYDQVSFKDDPNGVTANLKTGTATDGWGNTDTLNSIEMLRGSLYDDTLIGSNGRNHIRGLAGDDNLNGGKGRDLVRYDRDANYGGTDGVTVNLKKGFAIDGFGDRDTLKNFSDVRGTDSNDKIIGSGGKNTLEGEGGNDKLYGLGGADELYGGSGKDVLDGGTGNDDLYGEGGNDRFIFSGDFGDDTIYDFTTKGTKEKIDLSAISEIKSFKDLKNNHLSNVDGNAVITDNDGNTITLDGIVKADLSANDFIF